MQRLPHRGRQVLFAKAVPSLQPDERCDGLQPQVSIFGTEQLSAHIQRRHAQSRALRLLHFRWPFYSREAALSIRILDLKF
jgi:hypothetical protein